MRMSAKAEYAVRAMAQLASVDEGVLVTTEDLAKSQGIPAQFLVDILAELRATGWFEATGAAKAATNSPGRRPRSASRTFSAAWTVRWRAYVTSGSATFPTLVRPQLYPMFGALSVPACGPC